MRASLVLAGFLILAPYSAFAINEQNYDPAQQPTCTGPGVCFVPKFIEKATTVSAEQVADLVRHPDLVVLDVRSRDEYERGHLPYAMQIDDKELNADWLGIFLKSKDQPVLIYGSGPENSNASNATLIAVMNNYTNVMYFYGGVTEWNRAKRSLISAHVGHDKRS